MKAHTTTHNSVKLDNRELWFDGTVTVEPQDVLDALSSGVPASKLFVTSTTPDIDQYNRFADHKVGIKTELDTISTNWNIPEYYKTLNIRDYVLHTALPEQIDQNLTDSDVTTRIERVMYELKLYEQLNATDILRVLLFIINTLSEKHVIWGVGRGSSVASYILYLIGVHDIDSVKYQLDVTDFLR